MRLVSYFCASVFSTADVFLDNFFCLLSKLFIILITFILFLKSLQNNMIKSSLYIYVSADALLPSVLSFCFLGQEIVQA